MNYKKKGYFIDLAATDGIHENNTYFLEKKLNWDGICIEPNKDFFNKLKKNRNVSCFCEVIDNKVKKINFFPNKGIGGIVGEEFDNNFNKREKLLKRAFENNRIEKRETKTIRDILLISKAPKVIDYFSLDVEGAEENIIKNFPFNEYKILSMTIERPTPKINEILKSNDMLFVKNYKVDSFYINKILKDKIDIEFEKFSQLDKKMVEKNIKSLLKNGYFIYNVKDKKKLNFLKDDIFKESKKILKGKIKKIFSMNFII